MTWILIILNINGGSPAYIEMPDQTSCEVAAETTTEATVHARAWCIPGGEWPDFIDE